MFLIRVASVTRSVQWLFLFSFAGSIGSAVSSFVHARYYFPTTLATIAAMKEAMKAAGLNKDGAAMKNRGRPKTIFTPKPRPM